MPTDAPIDVIFAGTDVPLAFTIYESNAADAAVQDITGWTLSWRLKVRADDPDARTLVLKTTSSGIALTAPGAGVCTVTLEDTDTDHLMPGEYYHELKRTDAGFETVLSYGLCAVRRGGHRS